MNYESSKHETHWEGLACPFCKALFKADQRDLELSMQAFSCLSCKQVFWASLNKHRVETYISPPPKESAHTESSEDKICPHCFADMKTGVMECLQCGKPFYSSQWMASSPPSSFRLRKHFEGLLCDYGQPDKHDVFAALCLEEKNIHFGAFCYGRILKARPKDSHASRMLKYFSAVAMPWPQEVSSHSRTPLVRFWTYSAGWVHALLFCLILGALFCLYFTGSLLSFLK